MKKYFLMMSLFFAALLMVSCGDKKSSSDGEDNSDLTAEESIVKFLEAIQEEDVDAVYSFADKGRYKKEDAEEEIQRHNERHDGIKSFEIVDAEEEGSRARVKAKIRYNDGESSTLTYRLNKKSKGWVIVN